MKNKKLILGKTNLTIVASVFFYFLFFGFSAQAQVTIDNFDVVQKSIPKAGSSVDFQLSISQQDTSFACSSGHLDWVVFYSATNTNSALPFWVRSNSTDSRNTDLPLLSNPLDLNFNESNFSPNLVIAQQGFAYFQAALGCNLSAGNIIYTNNLALSAPVCVDIVPGSGSCNGLGPVAGRIDNFDIQPRKLSSNSTIGRIVQVSLAVTIFTQEFTNKCGVNNEIAWRIYEDIPGPDTQLTPSGRLPFNISGTAQSQYNVNTTLLYNLPVRSSPTTRNFYATLNCPGTLGWQITQSANIPITQNFPRGGSDICACVAADNVYACSPGGNIDCSDCSDISACGSRLCTIINSQLCGGTGPAQGGYKPGSDVTQSFQLYNPLFNDISNPVDFIILLTNWLVNAALPVAVVLIVWAGFLFLTSAGNQQRIGRAKTVIWYTVIGFSVILIAKGFVYLIDSFLRQ